jgi:hypothetical protein
MKKRLVGIMTASMVAISLMGCGATQQTTTTEAIESTAESATGSTTEAATQAESTDETTAELVGIANPWTESDATGVLNATGFELTAPEGATDVSYAYMAETGLAQISYAKDGIDWTYRVQVADELTDISGMYYEWKSEEVGTVSDREAIYYTFTNLNDDTTDDIMLVNWYDMVTGVTYSLSAVAGDLNGVDIQVIAESIYEPLQGEATDDAEADRINELNTYFLGTHVRSSDDSSITIADNGDGSFKVDIDITRLCSLEGGVGTFDEHKMYFMVTDPAENQLAGMIYRDSDNSLTIKILDSTWEYLANDEIIEGFGK